MSRTLPLLVASVILATLSLAPAQPPELLTVKVIRSHPHDIDCFTQGLFWRDGRMFESCGLYEKSRLREVALETGQSIREVPVPPEYFAEGLEWANGRLYQLTWRENTVLVYDPETFQQIDEMQYEGEGWGLAWDGQYLIMSNGSAELTYRDPATFAPVRTVRVHNNGRPVAMLNELEYVKGFVYANIFMQDVIVKIDPRDGAVVAIIHAAGLLAPQERQRADVLNGIAWNAESQTFYITGKLWPRLYEVEFVSPAEAKPTPPQTAANDSPTSPGLSAQPTP